MRIRVLLFGQLKEIFGLQEEVLEVKPGTSLADLMARYAERFPKFKPMAGSIACSVNREYAQGSVILREGDEVGLLPPVSGGSQKTLKRRAAGPQPKSKSHHPRRAGAGGDTETRKPAEKVKVKIKSKPLPQRGRAATKTSQTQRKKSTQRSTRGKAKKRSEKIRRRIGRPHESVGKNLRETTRFLRIVVQSAQRQGREHRENVKAAKIRLAGKVSAELRSEHCAIIRDKIESQKVADGLKAPEDGATAIFEGIVRNNTRGRPTLYLDYEAYEPMAINEMEKLAQVSLQQFKVRDVRLVHRLGRLRIGETSVLVVVASAHRTAAFEACRWIIDTLKKTIPIWKKEYFQDGAIWADGEPFPDEIRANTDMPRRSASK